MTSKSIPVYADHAATTPLMPEALDAMLPWLKEGFGNPSSLHSFGREAHKAVEEARATIAECIGAKPEEIFFTSGGTESDNWALKGVMREVRDLGRNRLAVSAIEHHAVLNAAQELAHEGFIVDTIDVRTDGWAKAQSLSDSLHPETGLVSIQLANNEIGIIQRIADFARITHRSHAFFHRDAVQAVGHIHIDVRELGVDLLSASAHKFNGPKGVGFLYMKKGTHIRAVQQGGMQELGMRAGTENVAGIVGMAAALKHNMENLADNELHVRQLADKLRDGIRSICPQAVFNGHRRVHLPGIINVAIPGHPAEGMLHILDMKGIAVSVGAACNSKVTTISHVLKAIGLSDEVAACTLRISLGPENTDDEVERILSVFKVFVKTAD
jgi:cysteine desulfurase